MSKNTKKSVKKVAVSRGEVLGHSPSSVLRAMGQSGRFDVSTAFAAINKLCSAPVDKNTVYIQLKAGAEGRRGAPAKLTRKDLSALKAAAK